MILKFALGLLIFCVSLRVLGQAEISGTWLLDGPGTESEIRLTQEGERIRSEYDLLVDDPSLYCTPASSSRVWANPNAPVKIELSEDQVLISYELFDLRREIPLGDESMMPDVPSTKNLNGVFFAEMGSSIARYAGNKLIIESKNHVQGYIRTSRGIPQSPTTLAIEELTVAEDVLRITHTYIDEAIFEKPLVLEYFFRRADDIALATYNCTDANYDWFDELNAN
ncbi:MAG: hypothetical protein WDZ52_14950 [Pseudohongiellaceae bacterium]